ncbi:LysR family transcriptional regulator (plasmid) [Paracoccus methylovorus]|uniref:LysR family transcriptional regulator n=1 Tax=Paracoccus methylovorus TaxID=2812658 RepID=A0ABX7JSH1_9RHOB|nr:MULTISPECIES: LysR family transcriptional regulator [Paracoccus]QRZ16188.1 LysR family transcriptional regulator [Paracoccus methylovorus]
MTETDGSFLKADTASRRPPKRRHLPSLGSFATFEVAAKHRSFTLAAEELHVTQAAISQQIRGLEKAIDCQLFTRKHNSMELTVEGQALLEGVTHGLDRLSDAIERISQNADRKMITIASTYAAISQYIKPLTDDYRSIVPEARFTLLASDENDRVQDFDEVDLAMICGNERSQIGDNLIHLFPEVVDPVCAPGYLAAMGPFDGPEDLLRADLMELHRMHWSSQAISWYPLRWSDWFRHHAPEIHEPAPQFVTNSYTTLVDAALAGEGVILGWRHLVFQDAAQGRLVRLFDLPLNAGRSYYLKLNRTARERQLVKDFVDFFRAEVAKAGAFAT